MHLPGKAEALPYRSVRFATALDTSVPTGLACDRSETNT